MLSLSFGWPATHKLLPPTIVSIQVVRWRDGDAEVCGVGVRAAVGNAEQILRSSSSMAAAVAAVSRS